MSEGMRDIPAEAKPSRPRRRWPAWLLLAVIFASGVLLGVSLTVLFRAEQPRGRKTIAEIRDQMTEKFADRLDLSAEQTEEVRRILEQRLAALQEIRLELRPRVEVQAAELEKQVAAVLTAAQKEKWQQYYAELHERWFPEPASTQPATQPAPP